MDDDDFVEKTYEFAQDTTKQLITLASAIVALTITFSKDFAPSASECSRDLMGIAWIAFFFSILGGLGTLFQLTGKLAKKKRTTTDMGVVIFSGGQQLLFLIALVLTIVAGWLAMGRNSEQNSPPPAPPCSTCPTSNAPVPGPTSTSPVSTPMPDTGPRPEPAPVHPTSAPAKAPA